MKIFVAGLPYDLDDAELEEIFEKFGKVVSAKVAMDRETGKSKGFGFVEMPNEVEAKEAIEGLNDISLGKKPLIVKQAEDKPGGSSQGGGGYRGGSSGEVEVEVTVVAAEAVVVEVTVAVAVAVETGIEDLVPAARETDVINFSCKIYSQIIVSSYRSILFL
jgi:RNA recognition motif-containing protein